MDLIKIFFRKHICWCKQKVRSDIPKLIKCPETPDPELGSRVTLDLQGKSRKINCL